MLFLPSRYYQPRGVFDPAPGGGGSTTVTALGAYTADDAFGGTANHDFTVDLTGVISSDLLTVFVYDASGGDLTQVRVDTAGANVAATNDFKTTEKKMQCWRATGITGGTGKVIRITSTAGAFAFSDVGIVIYKSTGVGTVTPSSGSAVVDWGFISHTAMTGTVTVPTGGHAMGCYVGNNGTATALPLTWTGATRRAITEAHTDTGNGVDVGAADTTSTGSVTISQTATSVDFKGGAFMIVSRGP